MSKSGKKERTFTVESPRLWDIDDPHLYTLDIAGETFRYGIRTIAFYPDARGFQLNGRRVELKGVCLHHDLGVLGAAYNRAAMKRRFLKLKEAGVNAIRCSHNPDASRPSCARIPMRRKQSPSRLHLLDSCASRPHCIGRWKTLIFTFHTLALDGAEKRA